MTDSSGKPNLTVIDGHGRVYQAAMNKAGIELYYQPIVASSTRKACWYECLVRVRDNQGQIVPTAPVIAAAEAGGLVTVIDLAVLTLAVEDLCVCPDVSLAVNVSGHTTDEPVWLSLLTDLVRQEPGIASRLVVEITETAALRNLDRAVAFVRAVRDLGCRVALDDFGTGYNSLAHVRALPVDILKIDGSLIADITICEADRLTIRALQMIADAHGLCTVAEHVETEEVARVLAALDVDYLQGYLFGRPVAERPWWRTPKQGLAIVAESGEPRSPITTAT